MHRCSGADECGVTDCAHYKSHEPIRIVKYRGGPRCNVTEDDCQCMPTNHKVICVKEEK